MGCARANSAQTRKMELTWRTSDNDKTSRANAQRPKRRGRSSNLEGTVLDIQRWRGRAGCDAEDHIIGPAYGTQCGRAQPCGSRQQSRWYGRRCAVIGRLRERMAMLLAARQIGHSRFCAVRHVGRRCHCRRFACLDRAHIRRHRDLLEQQAEQRDQRNPAAVAGTAKHSGECTSVVARDPRIPQNLTARSVPPNTCRWSLSATAALLLNRRTFYRTERTEHAAVARIRPQQGFAAFAFVEELAGIRRHDFLLDEAAMRTG